MHRKIIEATLQGLEGKRAAYFSDIANRLDQNPRTEPIANMVFTVLGDVMAELPTYLEAAELIGLLLSEDVADRPASWDVVLQHPFLTEASKAETLLMNNRCLEVQVFHQVMHCNADVGTSRENLGGIVL